MSTSISYNLLHKPPTYNHPPYIHLQKPFPQQHTFAVPSCWDTNMMFNPFTTAHHDHTSRANRVFTLSMSTSESTSGSPAAVGIHPGSSSSERRSLIFRNASGRSCNRFSRSRLAWGTK